MGSFGIPADITFNRGRIADPEAFAQERADADDAPFAGSDELHALVSNGLTELAPER